MCSHGLVFGGPASSSSTRCLPEAVRRFASTQPALPAPTMMKSYVSAACVIRSPRRPSGLLRATVALVHLQTEVLHLGFQDRRAMPDHRNSARDGGDRDGFKHLARRRAG